MSDYGVRKIGFLRPTKAQILETLRATAKDDTLGFGPNVDLGAHSPLGRWIAGLAERLDEIWQDLEDVYYSAFLPTADGLSLSLKAAEMGISRREADAATGIVTIYGDEGVVIPEGLSLQSTSGELFSTTESRVIPARGRIDVAIEAEEAGDEGNVAASTITTIVDYISGLDSVENEHDPGTTLLLGVNSAGSIAIAADGETNDYQLVALNSLLHPHTLDEITVGVVNDAEPTPFEATYHVHLEVIDDTTGELIGRTESQSFSLDVSETSTLTFTSQGIDVHNATGDYIRVAIVNEATSEAVLGLAYDDNNQYQSGALYLNAVEQTDYDAIMTLVTILEGATAGGSEGETDAALRKRYKDTSATFGSGTAEAVLSQIYRVEGVLSATVTQNRENTTVDGMDPHSIEATVYGGAPADIGKALLESVAAGCKVLGSSAVTVRDTIGQAHVMHYNAASRSNIYLDLTLSVTGEFSHNLGIKRIKDAIVGYIGGVDSNGTYYIGLVPGADVIRQKIVALAMEETGVDDVTVLLDTSSSPTGTTNISIDNDEVAETKLSYIDITTS